MKQIDSIADLTPDPRNARKHNPRNIKMIQDSLHEVGAARSIVIDENGVILAGNGVTEAANLAGIEKVQVVDADGETIVAVRRTGLTAKQKKRLALADNRTNETSDWDADILAEIAAQEGDLLKGLFNDDELAELIGQGEGKQETANAGELIDKAAELQKKWQVSRGDVWEIGKHRLVCGDSTNAADVAKLMGGEKASLTVTSPPYFNQREYSQWESYEDYLSFVALIVGETSRALDDNAIFVVNIGSDEQARRWMPSDWWTIIRDSDANWLYRECIAWVKAAAVWNVPRSMHIENGHYFPALRWEVMLVASRGKHPSFEKSDRDAVREFDENVWTIPVVSGNEQKAIGHNAPFPIEIPRRFIMAYTTKEKTVYEPFCGSGTTLAACEMLGRAGRAMELSEKYCAVTLERMSLLGIEPRRVES